MADGNVTIIKKRKVSSGGGHHGGAWKVAYADFVTAMMAFFLLMWLLNATTEKQRKGIADYFSPTIPIHQSSSGGEGPMTASTVFADNDLPETGQTGAGSRTKTSQENGATEASDADSEDEQSKDSDDRAIVVTDVEDEFELLEGMFLASGGESDLEDPLLQNIRTRVTDEGLVIELFDREDAPLFDGQSDIPTPLFSDLLKAISTVALTVRNQVAVKAHSFSVTGPASDAANWRLSTNRSLVAVDRLTVHGLAPTRIARVTGFGNRQPAFDDLNDRRNNRIEIILIR